MPQHYTFFTSSLPWGGLHILEKSKDSSSPRCFAISLILSRISVLKSTLKVLTSPWRPDFQRDASLTLWERVSNFKLCKIFPTQPGIRHKSKQSFWLPVGYWFSLSAPAFPHPLSILCKKWNMRFEKLKILKVTGYSVIMGYVRIPFARGLM